MATTAPSHLGEILAEEFLAPLETEKGHLGTALDQIQPLRTV